ncbi:MAG: hypothetical protein CME26_11855 [Gemmatimonadetes bacterium]|nr:hypothetical protein [Gemmatimonadota bacterium]|tara:strand:+ start:746 stop:1921 length:1176 start_codon:yes stop_codon:yes gene_type:complete
MSRPLDGVVVLEMGEGISAAYCTSVMATLGADVIKIEASSGDPSRRLGPFPEDILHLEKSGLFLYLNRNKRSVVLDLDDAAGQDALRALSSRSSIVVENFAPGYLAERGLGYETLSRDQQTLVMTSITPFGQDGPYRDYRATEITVFALGGYMSLIGDRSRAPLKFGGSVAQYTTGLYASTATLTALHLAEEAGMGQYIDISVMESMTSDHSQDTMDYSYRGFVRERESSRVPIPCADGFISFSVQAHRYEDFRRLILGDRAEAEEADDAVARDQMRMEGDLDTEILQWSYDKSKYEAYLLAQDAHVPAAFVADMSDLVESPQYAAREYFVEIDHPEAGTQLYPGFPARLTGADWQYSPAPLLGEHTEEVLSELTELSAGMVAELAATEVA